MLVDKMNLNYDVLIVGGGSSGLVTSLMIKSALSHLNVGLIYSKKTPIIGVGEGTTEHFKLVFNDSVGIDFREYFIECDATIKMGVEFINWGNHVMSESDRYYHNLTAPLNFYSRITDYNASNYCMDGIFCKGLRPEDIYPSYEKNSDKLANWLRPNQIHINTHKFNAFMKKKCEEKNITLIEDEIIDLNFDENGFVTSIRGEREYQSKFFIDCTGFKRLFSNKMGIKFISMTESFPLNRAIPFREEHNKDNFSIYTKAISMKNGWLWQIPTANEYGRGYVYSSEFCTDDEAIDELENLYGKNRFDFNRIIKFESGVLEKAWEKNVCSVGLSSNFFEPLEATNITAGIRQVELLIPKLKIFLNNPLKIISEQYNDYVHDLVNNFSDFIKLHYLCSRKDTKFWEANYYQYSNNISDSLRVILEKAKYGAVTRHDIHGSYTNHLFDYNNFNMILYGLGLINVKKSKDNYEKILSEINDLKNYSYDTFMNYNLSNEYLVNHREIIERIKDLNLPYYLDDIHIDNNYLKTYNSYSDFYKQL